MMNRFLSCLVVCASVAAVQVRAYTPEALTLVTFGEGFDSSKIHAEDATVTVRPAALRIQTGHKKQWPGITLPAPGKWDLSPYAQVELAVKNAGNTRVSVTCRVDNPGANGTEKCVSGSLRLEPGETQTLKVNLTRCSSSRLDGKLFGMRGYPVGPGGKGTIDAANITQVLVFVAEPKTDAQFEISEVRAAGHYVPPTAWVTDATPFFPFIDTFGQYKHKDWPGKLHSVAELVERREAEKKEIAAKPGPDGWDRYGGWASGPQLKGTGFFRTEKVQGKWWLVDPDGRLFFSQGIDCVRARHSTAIHERATWFENFPGESAEFEEFRGSAYALKGYYAGRSPKTFSFNTANLYRKYGSDFETVYPAFVHERLRSWGINTIANWSDEKVRLMRRTPYTDTVGSRGSRNIAGSEGYWGKFPDPFDPAFKESLRRQMAGKRGRTAGDPWCIGYFSDNEMSWGDEISLSISTLKSPSDQPAKKAFIEKLRGSYGTIEKLNAAWGTAHASWDALLESTSAPDKQKARADLGEFYSTLAEQYFRTVRDAIKESAPQQLYLGCRFAWVNDRAAAAAAKYCDVVSYNLYHRSVAAFKFNGGADVPLIIGEFHFGALDRGMFHTGLVPVATQEARARAYQEYVEGALRHPQFVGCHWFEYQDEPNTGRVLDEENYQIGFVDVTDTPYAETVAAARQVGAEMYEMRFGGKSKP